MIGNVELEMRLLGGCLKSINWVNSSQGQLSCLHFICPRNREIWLRMKDLYENDRSVTLETIEPLIDVKTCSVEYLLTVYGSGSLGIDLNHLLEELKGLHAKRQLEDLGLTTVNSSRESKSKYKDIVQECENRLFLLSQNTDKKIIKNIPESVNDPMGLLPDLQRRQQLRKEGINPFLGIPTHYTKLDEYLKGLCPGHFTLIGARPGMGKTTFALNIAERVVKNSKESVLFFSLEMPGKELAEKLICLSSRVPFQKFKDGSLNAEEYQRMVVSYYFWEKQNFFIDEQPALGIEMLRTRALRYKRTHDISLIIIDYVQLLRSSTQEVRHLEIADISRKLKEIAKEISVPVVALAQLNREVEKRTDKRPFISDLRESGSLEADADEVLLLHRKEVYDPYEKPGLIQVYLSKNRFGPQGEFELSFEKETGKIENYDFEHERSKNLSKVIPNARTPHDDFLEGLNR